MVSLIKNLEYYTSITSKYKILAFKDFLENKNVSVNLDSSNNEGDIIFMNLISSFIKNNKKQFLDNFNKINIKIPTSESVWIHDNFLILVLICCIEKFEVDRNWLTGVIRVRDSSNIEYQSINKTFINILNNNLHSNENLYVIVIVFLHILNKPNLSCEILDKIFLKISKDTKLLESKNDFLIMVTLMAFEIIIITKDTPDAIEISNLKLFKSSFLKRVTILQNIIYVIILISFIILSIIYLRRFTDYKEYLTDFGFIINLLGLSCIAFFKWIRKTIKFLILKLLSYNRYFKADNIS